MTSTKRSILTKTITALTVIAASIITIQQAQAAEIINEEYRKAVNNVMWYKQANISADKVLSRTVPKNMTSLVFIRRQDNDPEQASANITVNDRFQVSLQSNGYSQVYSCAGINFLSAEPTGLKTNDLLQNSSSFNLVAEGTYYFYVDISDDTGSSNITQITEDSATSMLSTKKYQTHQISRVVPNCPEVAVTPQVIQAPVIPKLGKTVNIELEVLFDTDKHLIKAPFYQEVAEVAEFMRAYPNTTSTIEGHTDSRAPANYNQSLSQRRANAVKAMLVNKYGINPNRLEATGYGETRPRAPNDTAANLQKNRRVIAVINERVRLDENGKQIND